MLDDRRKFVALGYLHADAGDVDIGDFQLTADIDQIPVHLDRTAARPNDLTADHAFVAAATGAEDPERLAAILPQPAGIGLDDIFLEQLQKFLLLLRRRRPPIPAEHELADAGNVEIVAEQLTEPSQALRRGDVRPKHLDGFGAKGA